MKTKRITVFEHQSLKVGQNIDGVIFDEDLLSAFQQHFGTNGVEYFTLINNGVKFNEFVGALQIGGTLIEILPKADKEPTSTDIKSRWHEILIDMLKTVGDFEIQAPTSGFLEQKPNSVLDLYFELFVSQIEYLVHRGLIKKYNRVEENLYALKGSLNFQKQLRHNIIHKERFFVRHDQYNFDHRFHQIIYKTLDVLQQINRSDRLSSRIGSLLLYFPEMGPLNVSENFFDRLHYSRKSVSYKPAIEIARLILLHYHPDLRGGKNNLLAISFDMNTLWERFIFVCLRKHVPVSYKVSAQASKNFWRSESGVNSTIRPDIVVETPDGLRIVLDTKWKMLNGSVPAADDLRQMFIYREYFEADKIALVYPGGLFSNERGFYYKTPNTSSQETECAIVKTSLTQERLLLSRQVFEQLKIVIGDISII